MIRSYPRVRRRVTLAPRSARLCLGTLALAMALAPGAGAQRTPPRIAVLGGSGMHGYSAAGGVVAGAFERSGGPGVQVFRLLLGGTFEEVALHGPTSGTPASETSYGYALETDGHALAVGAPTDGQLVAGSGLVYVYERDAGGPGTWGPVALLAAPTPVAGERFGDVVALRGEWLAVGAPGSPVPTGSTGQGRVHLFRRLAGQWVHAQVLEPPAGSSARAFGRTVVLDEGTLAVAGLEAGPPAHGRVDLFALQGGAWTAVAGEARPDLGPSYGRALALADGRLAIGVPSPTADPASAGEVRLRERDAGGPASWGEVATLQAPAEARAGSRYGWSLALEGRRLVVGAPEVEPDGSPGGRMGSAWAYRQGRTGSWLEEVRLGVESWSTSTQCGRGGALAVLGDLLVSAPRWPTSGVSGTRTEVHWLGRRRLLAPAGGPDPGPPGTAPVSAALAPLPAARRAAAGFALARKEVDALELRSTARNGRGAAGFGGSMAHGGGLLVVSSRDPEAGALVFEQVAGSWQPVARLVPAPGGALPVHGWGASVSTDGDTVVVGANGVEGTALLAGSAVVFERDAGGPGAWGQTAVLTSGSLSAIELGTSVAVDGDLLAVGAPRASAGAGAVVIFERAGGAWSEAAVLTDPDEEVAREDFGVALGLEGTRLAAVSRAQPNPATTAHLAVFERSGGPGTPWLPVSDRALPPGEEVAVYDSLDLDGDRIAWGRGTGALSLLPEGAVRIYRLHPDEGLLLEATLTDPPGISLYVGAAVDLEGDRLLTAQTGSRSGIHGLNLGSKGQLFGRDGDGVWQLLQELEAPDWRFDDAYGTSVALLGDTLLVGAPGDDDLGNDSGSVYVFEETP